MTCFWDGLLGCLHPNDFSKIGISKKPSTCGFVSLLKNKNKITENVLWQDTKLTDKFKKECFDAINELDVKSINRGYLCSTCDPFLILVSELFKVNIIHKYCNVIIKYKCINAVKTINVKSNKGHFQRG